MHKLIAAIFTIFAIVQYNDPDFYIWVPAYLLISVLIILFDRGISLQYYFLAAALVYGGWMLLYVPDVITWMQEGLPSITGSMQAESPFIEFVREFFGLAICLAVSLYYWVRSKQLR